MEDMEKKLAFLLATNPCISLAGTYGTYARAVRDLINNGVVVRERGEWIWSEENECWVCSKCELSALNNYRGNSTKSDFCSHCGADMRKGENG